MSVRVEQLSSHREDFHEILYLSICRKSFEDECHYNPTRKMGTLRENLCTFILIVP